MRVLDVVDRVLLGPLGREVDVDLDRLVGPAVDQVPARRVHADLVHEVVEKDDLAATLRHRRLLAAAGQVDELVEQHLDALLVVAEHPCDRRVPAPRAVVVGAEHIDRPVEAAVELVREVDHVGGAVRRRSTTFRRADQDAVGVVAVGGGAGPDGAVVLVGVQARQVLGKPCLQLALEHPRVEVDTEALEARLDLPEHPGHRILV